MFQDMNLRNLLDDFNFKIDPMFGKKYYVQKALTLLARGDHRAGGQVPTTILSLPKSGGGQKSYAEFRPTVVRAGGGQLCGWSVGWRSVKRFWA